MLDVLNAAMCIAALSVDLGTSYGRCNGGETNSRYVEAAKECANKTGSAFLRDATEWEIRTDLLIVIGMRERLMGRLLQNIRLIYNAESRGSQMRCASGVSKRDISTVDDWAVGLWEA